MSYYVAILMLNPVLFHTGELTQKQWDEIQKLSDIEERHDLFGLVRTITEQLGTSGGF